MSLRQKTQGIDRAAILSRTTKTPERSTSTLTATESARLDVERLALAKRYEVKAERDQERGRVIAAAVEALPEPVHVEPVIGEKVTSPELAKLAGKYVAMSERDMYMLVRSVVEGGDTATRLRFFEDVRRLAASVLSQAEGGKP